VAVDALQVFRLAAVDVARQVEVEIVLGVANFGDWHQARVAGLVQLARESVDDAMDILRPQAIFRAVFGEALGGVDREDALAGDRVLSLARLPALRGHQRSWLGLTSGEHPGTIKNSSSLQPPGVVDRSERKNDRDRDR